MNNTVIAMLVAGLTYCATCTAQPGGMPPLPPSIKPADAALIKELRYEPKLAPQEVVRRRALLVEKVRNARSAMREGLSPPAAAAPPQTIAPGMPGDQADKDAAALAAWTRALENFNLESICGPLDNSVDVELYAGSSPAKSFVQNHQSSVAQLQWLADIKSRLGPGGDPGNVTGERWCSGTLIASNFFLTAAHCFGINNNGWTTPLINNKSLPPEELGKLMQANFNYQVDGTTGNLRPEVSFKVKRVVEISEGGLDYAIVELENDAGGRLPSESFKAASTSVAQPGKNQLITVIQHPNGNPKKVAAGAQVELQQSVITYSDVDTLGGSSGAGIIDRNGKLIGVHTNGGCMANGGANSGVTLHAISLVSKIIK